MTLSTLRCFQIFTRTVLIAWYSLYLWLGKLLHILQSHLKRDLCLKSTPVSPRGCLLCVRPLGERGLAITPSFLCSHPRRTPTPDSEVLEGGAGVWFTFESLEHSANLAHIRCPKYCSEMTWNGKVLVITGGWWFWSTGLWWEPWFCHLPAIWPLEASISSSAKWGWESYQPHKVFVKIKCNCE